MFSNELAPRALAGIAIGVALFIALRLLAPSFSIAHIISASIVPQEFTTHA